MIEKGWSPRTDLSELINTASTDTRKKIVRSLEGGLAYIPGDGYRLFQPGREAFDQPYRKLPDELNEITGRRINLRGLTANQIKRVLKAARIRGKHNIWTNGPSVFASEKTSEES